MKHKSKTKLSTALLFSGVLVLSQQAAAETLKWAGCGISKKAYMAEIAKTFKNETGNKVLLLGGGSGKGYRAVGDGSFEVGGACRPPFSEEASSVATHHVAWDPLVAVVAKSNTVAGITSQQLKDILTGKIDNWSALGGSDAPIKLIVRKGKRSGVGATARTQIFGDPEVEFSGADQVVKSSGPVEVGVSKDPYAIGITGGSSAKKRSDTLKMLSLDGVAPSKENLMAGQYPYYRPLYLITAKKPAPVVEQFVAFVLGDKGQAVISGQGTVNLTEGKSLQK